MKTRDVSWSGVLLFVALIAASVSAQESRPFEQAHPLLAAGPMVGHASETEVLFWVQTTAPARVEIECAVVGSPEIKSRSDVVQTRADLGFCAALRLSGLPFGKVFDYRLFLDGVLVAIPHTTRFQTQPHWQFRTDPPEFNVAFGSCSFINDPLVDRPGRPYGGSPEIFRTIAAMKPTLMLWLGDNIYFREPDWSSRDAMIRRYSYDRRLPELQPLLSSTHHYAIWDDHDFGPDNSDWTFSGRDDVLDVFRLFWRNPNYGLKEAPGVFCRFTWGDVEFFFLDDRSYRSPNRRPPDAGKTMLGDVQTRWLIDSLTSSDAVFKVIACGSQMLNQKMPHESFGHFPWNKAEVLEALATRRISGVFFLSGDRHHAELIRHDREGSYSLFDFTSSPLTSGVHLDESERINPQRVEGTLVADQRNFGILRFAGPRAARHVTLECRNHLGEILWSHKLSASELRTP